MGIMGTCSWECIKFQASVILLVDLMEDSRDCDLVIEFAVDYEME